MKKCAAFLLAALVLCLSACGRGADAGMSGGDGDSAAGSSIVKTKQFKSQKCPDTISLYGEPRFFLNWQKNSVTVTVSEAEIDGIDRAEFTPETNTLRFYIKESNIRFLDCVFDSKGRLTDMIGTSAFWDGVSEHVALSYNEKGTLVYGDRLSYDSEHEPTYSGGDHHFILQLCRNADGYAASSKNGVTTRYSKQGDGFYNPDEMEMEYDKGGNLLCVRDKGTGSVDLAYTYTDMDRSYWQQMVVSMLHSLVLAAGGGGDLLSSYPILYQMGYQITHSCSEKDLYAQDDAFADVDYSMFRSVYERLVEGEELEDVLEEFDRINE